MLLRFAAIAGVSALAFATAFVGSARSGPLDVAEPSAGGIFIVTYTPQRVTSKDARLAVRFTTTGRAQPGWEYYVYFVVQGKRPKGAAKPRCAWRAASWIPGMVERVQHISGVGSYTVPLRAVKSLGGHFCTGRAVIEVGTAPTGHQGDRRRLLRSVPLRVAPAR